MSQNDLFGECNIDSLSEVEGIDIEHTWPTALVDMIDVVAAALRQGQVTDALARQHAITAMRALAEYHGGHQFYLPKGDALKVALRDKEMWDAYTGDNVDALARQHRVTTVRVYEILRRQRALHVKKIQRDMFEEKTQ